MTFPSIEQYFTQHSTILTLAAILFAVFGFVWLWNRCSKRLYGAGPSARPLIVAAMALYVGTLLLITWLCGFVTVWQGGFRLSEVAEIRVELVDEQKPGVIPAVAISDRNLIQDGLNRLSSAMPGGFVDHESKSRFFLIRPRMAGASEYSSNYIIAVDKTNRRESVSIVIPTFDLFGIQTQNCWFDCPQFLDWLRLYVEPLLTKPTSG